MTEELIVNGLIKAGVKNLKEFGYEHVNKENILTDEVYKIFFKSMLEENLGSAKSIDSAINKILVENY